MLIQSILDTFSEKVDKIWTTIAKRESERIVFYLATFRLVGGNNP